VSDLFVVGYDGGVFTEIPFCAVEKFVELDGMVGSYYVDRVVVGRRVV
jgi:hypothetical protein